MYLKVKVSKLENIKSASIYIQEISKDEYNSYDFQTFLLKGMNRLYSSGDYSILFVDTSVYVIEGDEDLIDTEIKLFIRGRNLEKLCI